MSVIGDFVSGIFGGGDAAEDAARIQQQGTEAGVEETRRQFDEIMRLLGPSVEAGDLARQQQLALLGLSGPEAQAAAMQSFQESPGQQFMREQQERALLRNSAAIGGLGGGNVRSALQQQAAGFAQQDFGNQFNRLAGLSGSGQAAASNLGQFGQASAGNIANLLMQGGAAQASGILGAQQANAGMAQNLLGLGALFFSDRSLKENIKQVGTFGKLKTYLWDWKDGSGKGYGFMADEVEKEIPEAVIYSNGKKAVNYDLVRRLAWV